MFEALILTGAFTVGLGLGMLTVRALIMSFEERNK